ncbi:MAG: hypothetical protein ACLFPL_02035 [Candidatus Nanoarchaeia archaeon]
MKKTLCSTLLTIVLAFPSSAHVDSSIEIADIDENTLCGYTYQQWLKKEPLIDIEKTVELEDGLIILNKDGNGYFLNKNNMNLYPIREDSSGKYLLSTSSLPKRYICKNL